MDKKELNLDTNALLDEQEDIYCLAKIGKQYSSTDYPDLQNLDKRQLIKIINGYQDKFYNVKGLFSSIIKLGLNNESYVADIISELDIDLEDKEND